MEDIKEISIVVKTELAKRQSYYAKLCGLDRQAVNGFIKGRSNFKPETVIKIYKVIREDLNQK